MFLNFSDCGTILLLVLLEIIQLGANIYTLKIMKKNFNKN